MEMNNMQFRIPHRPRYFKAFDKSPNMIVAYETHDIQNLIKLLKDEKVCQNLHAKQRLITYINRVRRDRNNEVEIVYYKNRKMGKFIAKDNLQYIDRTIKEKIYKVDGYVSLDITNRGYTIINEVAKYHGIDLPAINYFVQNREQVFQDHLALWPHLSEIYDVKCLFLQMIDSFYDYDMGSSLMQDMNYELLYVNCIFFHPKYSYLNLHAIIEIYSSYIMNLIVDYLVINEVMKEDFYSLNGDEIFFQPLKPFEVSDIENYIFQDTGFNIKLHN
uniref:Uncharacterized protein n=1 Tax=Panagrolaimus sp. ES5 TaxID=591445 RepID=A0AC34F2J0_9BILA